MNTFVAQLKNAAFAAAELCFKKDKRSFSLKSLKDPIGYIKWQRQFIPRGIQSITLR